MGAANPFSGSARGRNFKNTRLREAGREEADFSEDASHRDVTEYPKLIGAGPPEERLKARSGPVRR